MRRWEQYELAPPFLAFLYTNVDPVTGMAETLVKGMDSRKDCTLNARPA